MNEREAKAFRKLQNENTELKKTACIIPTYKRENRGERISTANKGTV